MKKTRFITHAAIIAALYVALTAVSNAFGLASRDIQVRISEALTVLPFFTAAAVPGLFLGCFIANYIFTGMIWDVVFGSIATLIGALGTYILRSKKPIFAVIPPILSNMIIIPFILRYAYGIPGSIPYFMLTVGIGEVISCGILGYILLKALEKHRNIFI